MTIPSSVAVGNGGAWVNGIPFVGNGGAWHAVKNAWVGSGDSWRQCFEALGPFAATNAGWSGSGASSAGSGRTITENWSGQVPAFGFSGGPTSGNFSYAWVYVSGDATVSASATNVEQPTFSGSFVIGPQTTATDSAVWQCRITDTVSGDSDTVTGIVISYTYTNNTG
ncbi:MAG: hypothetical protein ACREFW_07100 [Rhizomicrobium sp.]